MKGFGPFKDLRDALIMFALFLNNLFNEMWEECK